MMRLFPLLVSVLFSFTIHAKTLKVAVIDTGYDFNKPAKLCKTGHIDFTNTTLNDTFGHGTNIVGLIDKNAGDSDYCIVIVKYYSASENSMQNTINFIAALNYVKKINADIINLSAGGPGYFESEYKIIKELLDDGAFIIAAAGNDKQDLDKKCYYYPACYHEDIIIIGNKHNTSNYGKVIDIIVDGVDKEANGITLTGTSQSTAIVTGKFIKYVSKRRKHKN